MKHIAIIIIWFLFVSIIVGTLCGQLYGPAKAVMVDNQNFARFSYDHNTLNAVNINNKPQG